MNNERRKEIEHLRDRILEVKADIEILQEAEQDYLDNMPESIQAGEKGSRAEEVICTLEFANEYLDNALESLEEAAQ